MSFVSVQEASRLISKSTQTIYRHIKAGKLSKTDKGIDTSELIRVYGELTSNNEAQSSNSVPPIESADVTWYKTQIEKLQGDLRELKQESLEREKRLLALLENKPSTSSDSDTGTGLFSRLFK